MRSSGDVRTAGGRSEAATRGVCRLSSGVVNWLSQHDHVETWKGVGVRALGGLGFVTGVASNDSVLVATRAM